VIEWGPRSSYDSNHESEQAAHLDVAGGGEGGVAWRRGHGREADLAPKGSEQDARC
jgi:hypothetical protein